MPAVDWREEYAASLEDVNLSNEVNMELVQTCSQMADRISALQAEIESLHVTHKASASVESSPIPKKKSKQPPPIEEPTDENSVVARLRLELAEALRSKGVSETRLRSAQEDVDRLQARTKTDSLSIRKLQAERDTLSRKLKDREHELREKRKLVENVQDEMITINLQLSVVEKDRDKIKQENKELIERWMLRKQEEVEAMNLANEPNIANRRGPAN